MKKTSFLWSDAILCMASDDGTKQPSTNDTAVARANQQFNTLNTYLL